MFTLTETAIFEQDIKKSRFLAICGPISSEDDAKRFLATHSDVTANHNCWAWRIGQAYRFSDDGEPRGTAGKPILQAIDGQSLDGVVAVVTRWFGGILLGSGGLIRAYGGTAASCLRNAAKVEQIATVTGTFACGFSDLALLQARLAASPHVQVLSEEFTASGADISIRVTLEWAAPIQAMISDLTRGQVQLRLDD
ncbi:IMPACT family protein [Rhizobium sp. LjRoot30]|uniref:IMPACT family protein n=1 Tax=Rhizobium sp. LjRoot30 TaxID=3342320 RepID=UPI003ECF31BF